VALPLIMLEVEVDQQMLVQQELAVLAAVVMAVQREARMVLQELQILAVVVALAAIMEQVETAAQAVRVL
jgi:hypothetical protein